MVNPSDEKSGWLAELSLDLALAMAALSLVSVLGTRWDWWGYRVGLAGFGIAGLGGLITTFTSVAGWFRSRGRFPSRGAASAVGALVLSLLVAGIPGYWALRAAVSPMINDVTTHPEDPPRFQALIAKREEPAEELRYGPGDAKKQKQAYPDLSPLLLAVKPDTAYLKAFSVVQDMGMRIVDSSRKQGRIEATDTTFWFGFKDDVVIRIRPHPRGSRVDVRSASRVGRSDLGTNARRIRALQQKLSAAVSVPAQG